ncbi:MAG: hypothetical protein KKA31_00260 [Candidatus Margulisbacteria bacterium]|nr:hypothetical protein [Candidatus Margulisiibacteriota bacterium]
MENKKALYDVASISRPGKSKRSNFVQEALYIDKTRIQTAGKFIKVFSDIFLKREAGTKSYI